MFKSHSFVEIAAGLLQRPAWKLETGNSGEDDVLLGATEEKVWADVTAHFDRSREALEGEGWTLSLWLPSTREEAISLLVEQDVGRWGEEERGASRASHQKASYGLLLNTVWARLHLADPAPSPALLSALEAQIAPHLTPEDMRLLRGGG